MAAAAVSIASPAADGGTPADVAVSRAPFAVVELFTSEGCSSCPAADALLGEIVSRARRDGRRVFGLAFHVDYWNGLGWRDPFSDASYTHRQSEYGRMLGLRSIYTPQMIVNGSREFVGSDGARARASIQEALGRPARAAVRIATNWVGERKLMVRFEVLWVGGVRADSAAAYAAAVQDGVVSHVIRGENHGRTLHHESVVRAFQSVPLDANGRGEVQLEIPGSVALDRASLIAFVQDQRRLEILGATQKELTDTPR